MKQHEIKAWVGAQDWSLRDTDIARQTGLSVTVVRGRRISAGIPRGTRSLSPRLSKWASVDWSRSNAELAAERGVSRQCVEFYRKRFANDAASA